MRCTGRSTAPASPTAAAAGPDGLACRLPSDATASRETIRPAEARTTMVIERRIFMLITEFAIGSSSYVKSIAGESQSKTGSNLGTEIGDTKLGPQFRECDR